jgi:hypothetical protein
MNDAAAPSVEGAWNPGIRSQIPRDLRDLSTVFRPANIANDLAGIDELRALTGLRPVELVVFRPERLMLHELLIRVTADFAVPSGSSIGDLGINFRVMATRLLTRHLEPALPAINAAYDAARAELAAAVAAALHGLLPGAVAPAAPPARFLDRIMRRRMNPVPGPVGAQAWGPAQIGRCERLAEQQPGELGRLVHRTLARVLSALFNEHGQAWGTRELIARLATDIACNSWCSDAIGACIEPLLIEAARIEGYERLPLQQRPVVINTKGPSAAGKSSLRPLQERLTAQIGVRWADFALISPDIWRKQLLDYGTLGSAYKYAGSFTADELQVVDTRLDRYMARKAARGEMTHLLIDRFRFDSFAADSDEAGSNLLTRFGHRAHLFFVITPPADLVERAWHRGLEFGRFKAVDDTLAHAVDAYAGIPKIFFTWVGAKGKIVRFEFLDNGVPFGERPRTVAFGDNETCNLLDVGRILAIERYGRINVNATRPQGLYGPAARLEPAQNCAFLRRCLESFRSIHFADQASGRVYLRIRAGGGAEVDRAGLQLAMRDPDTAGALAAVVPRALLPDAALLAAPQSLRDPQSASAGLETIGNWGWAELPGAAG